MVDCRGQRRDDFIRAEPGSSGECHWCFEQFYATYSDEFRQATITLAERLCGEVAQMEAEDAQCGPKHDDCGRKTVELYRNRTAYKSRPVSKCSTPGGFDTAV